MSESLLGGLRVVTTALNLPGPLACSHLQRLGAEIIKVEPPDGDLFIHVCEAWYQELVAGQDVRKLNLKSAPDQQQMEDLLATADLLLTSQRLSALERMGLSPAQIRERHPHLCMVAIIGHPPPNEHIPGHDLTYLATLGLLEPPAMPRMLVADFAGGERAAIEAIGLLLGRERGQGAHHSIVSLEDCAKHFGQPYLRGLTPKGQKLGGATPGYNIYPSKDGMVAIAAVEFHFAKRLDAALGVTNASIEQLREAFGKMTTLDLLAWAAEHDLPIVQVKQ